MESSQKFSSQVRVKSSQTLEYKVRKKFKRKWRGEISIQSREEGGGMDYQIMIQ